MKKYKKKPVIISAYQWDGKKLSLNKLKEIGVSVMSYSGTVNSDSISKLRISTLEGTMNADIGDFIIRGVEGEFYPCKPSIFMATYEEV